MKFFFLTLSLILFGLYLSEALKCYVCAQGYHTDTQCARILPADLVDDCTQQNPECIEAIEWFQNGALQLVRRRCATKGYCQNYPYKQTGVLKNCTSCESDRCNGTPIYQPRKPLECQIKS